MSNLAGQKVKLNKDIKDPYVGLIPKGSIYHIEDTWKNVTGGSWMFAQGNPAALNYAMRSAFADLPIDDNVYYGKINGLGFIVHESEIEVE